jgi:UDP-glucose 4-epimerase
MNDGVEYAGKRVLITGGLGFIGSNLARRLVDLGAAVTVIDSLIPEYGGNLHNVHDIAGRISIDNGDIRDADAIERLVPEKDYLFHLAAQTSHAGSMIDPGTDLEINTSATLALLEACRHHNRDVSVVFASTRQLYGRPEYLPVDEKHRIQPVDANGISKRAGEMYHRLYDEVYGIRSSVLRLTNTYGPGMRVRDARQAFLGVWVRNVLQGRTIQVFGDGKQTRDFNYVDDVVDALLLAASSDAARGAVFNLGSADVVGLSVLAETLVALHGSGRHEIVPFPEERKAIDIGDYYSDYTKIESVLGWKPAVGLEDGLKKTLAYYSAHGSRYW